MSIINELNLLKVISAGNIDINGLQERFIAFDERSVEMIMNILQNLKNKDYITAEKDFSNININTGIIKLTINGIAHLNTNSEYIHSAHPRESASI